MNFYSLYSQELRNKYDEFIISNPDIRVSFSKFKLMSKLDKKQKNSRASYQKLLNKKLYYQNKNKELRNKINEIKINHKDEVLRIKKESTKTIVREKIVKVTRPECVRCNKYARLFNRPIDVKTNKTYNLIKTIIGLKTLNNKLTDTDILILSLARVYEYLTISDIIKWSGLQRTTVFKSLLTLKSNDYISTSLVKSITGKKDISRYFITIQGEQELDKILNTINRKNYTLFNIRDENHKPKGIIKTNRT